MIGLIIIAAPSGAGKTSLIAALLKEFLNTKIKLSISFTTRKKRKDEIEGNSYFFISKKEFLLMKEKKEFLEELQRLKMESIFFSLDSLQEL